jgi:hypothetical protein
MARETCVHAKKYFTFDWVILSSSAPSEAANRFRNLTRFVRADVPLTCGFFHMLLAEVERILRTRYPLTRVLSDGVAFRAQLRHSHPLVEALAQPSDSGHKINGFAF